MVITAADGVGGTAGTTPASPLPAARRQRAWLMRVAGLSAGSLVIGLLIGFALPR